MGVSRQGDLGQLSAFYIGGGGNIMKGMQLGEMAGSNQPRWSSLPALTGLPFAR